MTPRNDRASDHTTRRAMKMRLKHSEPPGLSRRDKPAGSPEFVKLA
jgi:hypothetical protein